MNYKEAEDMLDTGINRIVSDETDLLDGKHSKKEPLSTAKHPSYMRREIAREKPRLH